MINWKIEELKYRATDGFVETVHWKCEGIELEKLEGIIIKEHRETVVGSISYNGTPIIPYAELIEETVINWVKEKLGNQKVLEIEQHISNKIEEKKNPTLLNGKPWENN